MNTKIQAYIDLTRANKPIGIYLLLWPTLWALWVANNGTPDLKLLFIFILGVVLTRSAGCAINDFADRKFDAHIQRTQDRPLTNGRLSNKEALRMFAVLMLLAFVLVLFTNLHTILLSFIALALASCYPFMKRYTHFPQLILGAAFAWSIPMAFSASGNTVPAYAWLLYFATLLWTLAYDTFYALVDYQDDKKIGVKSTAILWGDKSLTAIALLQSLSLVLLIILGWITELNWTYYLSLAVAAALFIYQQQLAEKKGTAGCFQAFLNNNYVGLIIFLGILLSD